MHAGSIGIVACLLAGCGSTLNEPRMVGRSLPPAPITQALYPGHTVTLGAGDKNACWLVNQSDALQSDATRLTATITHDATLDTGTYELGHIAIGIRGASFDAAFAQLGLPLQTGMFRFGEQTLRDHAQGRLSEVNLHAMISGRGITFWPKNTDHCANTALPCAIFESFTANLAPTGGLLLGSVALNLGPGPFKVTLFADDHDMRVTVLQGNAVLAQFSCRGVNGDDPRCGPQAGDVAMADAFIAFVNGDAMAGRTVGATDIRVVHLDYPQLPFVGGAR